jgi:hypothetical protein
MLELKTLIDRDDHIKFREILDREMYDLDEVLMVLYAAVYAFNS